MSKIVVLNTYHSPEVLRHVYEKANKKRPLLEGLKVFRELLRLGRFSGFTTEAL